MQRENSWLGNVEKSEFGEVRRHRRKPSPCTIHDMYKENWHYTPTCTCSTSTGERGLNLHVLVLVYASMLIVHVQEYRYMYWTWTY